jgi:hypothetical protein
MQRHITYARNEPYPQPEDEPPGDSVGLFLEGIPTFKIWLAPPVDLERDLLDSTCTHIGLVPPIIIPGGMPVFLFEDKNHRQFIVRAHLTATQEQVESWVKTDSNGFIFVLIERGSRIIRQIRMLGVAQDFREELGKAWLSVSHPVDMRKAQAVLSSMDGQAVINAAALWAYNSETDLYELSNKHPAAV